MKILSLPWTVLSKSTTRTSHVTVLSQGKTSRLSPGTVLSKSMAIAPPTNMDVDKSTVNIWSAAEDPVWMAPGFDLNQAGIAIPQKKDMPMMNRFLDRRHKICFRLPKWKTNRRFQFSVETIGLISPSPLLSPSSNQCDSEVDYLIFVAFYLEESKSTCCKFEMPTAVMRPNMT